MGYLVLIILLCNERQDPTRLLSVTLEIKFPVTGEKGKGRTGRRRSSVMSNDSWSDDEYDDYDYDDEVELPPPR